MRLAYLLSKPPCFLAFLFFCSAPLVVCAQVYKCVDKGGTVSYSATPCPSDAKESKNVTSLIGECKSAECKIQRSRQSSEAQSQLLREQQAADGKAFAVAATTGEVKRGMTKAQVKLAWGEPTSIPFKGKHIETWEWNTKREEQYKENVCSYTTVAPQWYKGPPQRIYNVCQAESKTRTVTDYRSVTFTDGIATSVRGK